MEPVDPQTVRRDVQQMLREIALELESAAQGARQAADAIHDSQAAWTQVQQLYTRTETALHLLGKMKDTITEATASGAKRP